MVATHDNPVHRACDVTSRSCASVVRDIGKSKAPGPSEQTGR